MDEIKNDLINKLEVGGGGGGGGGDGGGERGDGGGGGEGGEYDMGDLDISWVAEHEKENNIDKNYPREPIQNIAMQFIYVDFSGKVEKTISEMFSIGENKKISKEHILQITQTKRSISLTKKYKIIDILLYNVTLEPENIQEYAKSDNFRELSSGFFKSCSLFNDIMLDDSIFIFHKVNTLYFIFKETESIYTIKSILKKDKTKKLYDGGAGGGVGGGAGGGAGGGSGEAGGSENGHKHTRRVGFSNKDTHIHTSGKTKRAVIREHRNHNKTHKKME